jgi:urease accessory protein
MSAMPHDADESPQRGPGVWLQPDTAAVPDLTPANPDRNGNAPPARGSDPRLLIWLSPAFPVGGFAYSHGLEKAVENGWIVGRAGLEDWLADLMGHGAVRNDLILLAEAWRATRDGDWLRLRDVADLAVALQPSRERHLEATQQGLSFVAAIEAAWPPPNAPAWAVATDGATPTYPVAIGFATAAHALALADTLAAYTIAVAGGLGSAAIRLGVVGQTDAQRVMAALLPQLTAAARSAQNHTLDDLGGAAWRSDIAAQQHETQGTRLFRS